MNSAAICLREEVALLERVYSPTALQRMVRIEHPDI